MATDFLIVARNQPGLYAYLQQNFAGDADVQVVMDRRVGERRRSAVTVEHDRRQSCRRSRPVLSDKLESIGFAIVRVE
ncbi:MAG: hypothetical protein HYU51_19005 [Candidatus Rokubacteria bacterium]|nr:hypothetical protein [Candidatus Rokubacteria bacterium]